MTNSEQGTRGIKKGPPAVPSCFHKPLRFMTLSGDSARRHRLFHFTVKLPEYIFVFSHELDQRSVHGPEVKLCFYFMDSWIVTPVKRF